jgi:hypothetical protein
MVIKAPFLENSVTFGAMEFQENCLLRFSDLLFDILIQSFYPDPIIFLIWIQFGQTEILKNLDQIWINVIQILYRFIY